MSISTSQAIIVQLRSSSPVFICAGMWLNASTINLNIEGNKWMTVCVFDTKSLDSKWLKVGPVYEIIANAKHYSRLSLMSSWRNNSTLREPFALFLRVRWNYSSCLCVRALQQICINLFDLIKIPTFKLILKYFVELTPCYSRCLRCCFTRVKV